MSPKLFEITFDSTSALPLTLTRSGLLTETYTYNLDGTMATAADGLSQVTTLGSWYRGIPLAVGFADSTGVSATVDAAGNITSVTNEMGFTTSYTHDAMGRITQITHPTGDAVAWAPTTISMVPVASAEYGIPAGHWRQTISTGAARKVTYFDGLWRPRLTHEYDNTSPGTATATSRFSVQDYDADGQLSFKGYPVSTLASVSASSTGVWTEYDVLGRPTSATQDSEFLTPLVTLTEYLTGFQVRTTNPRGQQTTLAYQTFEQPTTDFPVSIAMPMTQLTTITRTLQGEPTAITRSGTWAGGAQSLARSYVYDAHRRLCKTIEPETGATVVQYDNASNVVWSAAGLALPSTLDSSCTGDRTTAHGSGRRVDRTYDTRNRLLTLAFPDDNGDQTWTYTADGLPASVTTLNAGGATSVVNTYAYDKRRNLTGETVGITGWYTWALSYGYNANGHLATLGYPTGLNIAYAPNALGQPTQAGAYATGVEYFPNGAIKTFTYGNGVVHTMAQNGRQLPLSSTSSGGVLQHVYSYDENGNVLAIEDGLNADRDRAMQYDTLDRLIRAESVSFGGSGVHTFTYDVLDNLRSWRLSGGKDFASYNYDASNRLTSISDTLSTTLHTFTYDVQGNLATKDGVTHTFDYGNRLRSTGGETYTYDAHGRRNYVLRSGGGQELWHYSREGKMLFSFKGPTGQTTHENVYLGGSLVATIDHNWPSNTVIATKYQHTDALGTPVVVTDTLGAVLERIVYDPYGGAIGGTRSGIGFTGHVEDTGTALIYMQQRYYDPIVGKFLSADPINTNPNNGKMFNRYNYANNNPITFVDPDGRCARVTGSRICGNSVAIAMLATTAAQPQEITPAMVKHVGESQGAETEGRQSRQIADDANAAGQIAQIAGDSRAIKAFNSIDSIQVDSSDWSVGTYAGMVLSDASAVAYAEFPGQITFSSRRYFPLDRHIRVGKVIHEMLHLDVSYHESAVKEFNEGCVGWGCPFEGTVEGHKNKLMQHFRP